MRQTHIHIHIKTIGVEHREHIKTIKTQKAIQLNTRITLFDILIHILQTIKSLAARQPKTQAYTVVHVCACEDAICCYVRSETLSFVA